MKSPIDRAKFKLDTTDRYKVIVVRTVSGVLHEIKRRNIKIHTKEIPYRGARFPFDIAKPMGIRKLESLNGGIGVMADDQVASIKRFVEKGGGLVATGESSLYNKLGNKRDDYALGDLFGTHLDMKSQTNSEETLRAWANDSYTVPFTLIG